MRSTEASSLYIISTHVMGLYSHVYCTIKRVQEGKNLHKCRIQIATCNYEILAICSLTLAHPTE